MAEDEAAEATISLMCAKQRELDVFRSRAKIAVDFVQYLATNQIGTHSRVVAEAKR